MIKETEKNIEFQILYLEIISLACMDPVHNTGIRKYQNRVLSEFHMPQNNPLLKGLLTFHLIRDKSGESRSYVSFGKDKNVLNPVFIEYNPSLESNPNSQSNNPKYFVYEGKLLYSLEELSQYSVHRDIGLIVAYIVAVLNLNKSLCCGRNNAAINKAIELGLTYEMVSACMRNTSLHISLQTAFIHLYQVLYIDSDPFQSLSKTSNNRCYM